MEAWLEEVLEEEEGVNRRPDGGIQVCLEATDMIPHPKASDGGRLASMESAAVAPPERCECPTHFSPWGGRRPRMSQDA